MGEVQSTSAQSIIDSARNITDSGRPVDNQGDYFKHVYPAFSATVFMLNTSSLPTVRYINGTVIDSVNKTAIPGATVSATDVSAGSSLSTITDGSGFYSFAVTEGTYDVTVRSDPKYYTNSTAVSTASNAVIIHDVGLARKPVGNISGAVMSA